MKKIILIFCALFVTAIFADDGLVRPSRVIPNSSDSSSRTEITSMNSSVQARTTSDKASRRSMERIDSKTSERGVKYESSRSASARSGIKLRPSIAEVGGRAVIGRTNTMTGSNIDEEIQRKVSHRSRAAENPFDTEVITPEEPPTIDDNSLADCGTAYFDCLNQFCDVLDANQRQCSCSSRLSQYKDVEDSLNKANSELNNVAQQIRYVGLSADEVRSIMKETEAETVLSTTKDTTESRDMLEEIEKIIKSPDSINFGTSNSSSTGLDFELDFSGNSNGGLDLSFGSNESSSFSNMRGTDLYSAAQKKCKSILTKCAPQKTDQEIISRQYDIEIDKACVSYEAGLKKATQGVRANIRTATQMLQKARLAVLSNLNSYDARGCVNALDSCMKDEMVCGSNYYKCLDPTKTVIDENGEIIPGGDVITIKDLTEDYSSADITDAYLQNPIAPTCIGTGQDTTGLCIIYYLLNKIGYKDGAGRITSGFCRPVLDKCRMYTHNDNNEYIMANTIVKSYLERTMTQIRSAQSNIISEHASNCIHDVSTCYNSQLTQVNSYSGGIGLSPATVKPILMGACRNVALSCAYAVFSTDIDRTPNTLIDKLSEMFYQSMLCPANATWNNTIGTIASNYTLSSGTSYVNSNCQCLANYVVYSGTCTMVPVCPTNASHTDISTTIEGTEDTKGIPFPYCECNYTGVTQIGGVCPSS